VTNNQIKGVMVPILTPLTPDEQVDTVSLRRLVNYILDNGVHGIWAAGTNGEFASLSGDKTRLVVETVVDEVAGRVPVIGNVSSPATKLAIDLALSMREYELDGIAATPPYYYDCAQDELLDHYRRMKDQVGLPLWVYNIPRNVKTTAAPGTIAQLASEGSIVGVKDSSGEGENFAQLVSFRKQIGFELLQFLGSSFRITTAGAVGADGVIPGIGNLIPSIVSQAWEAGEKGDSIRAVELDSKLVSALRINNLAHGGSTDSARLAGMKSALKLMGILDYDTVSAPLRPLNEEEKTPISKILRDLGLDG